MRAIIISEVLNFSRDIDPKNAIGIGMMGQIKQLAKSQEKNTESMDEIGYFISCATAKRSDLMDYLLSQDLDINSQEHEILKVLAWEKNDEVAIHIIQKRGADLEGAIKNADANHEWRTVRRLEKIKEQIEKIKSFPLKENRMRAKTVNRKTKAYIWDFDDTLVKTDAKVHVYKAGKFLKSLTPEEFNFYQKAEDEEIDVSEFKDPRIILKAKPYKMWPALQNMDAAIKQGRSTSEIFILTARSAIAKIPIWTFFRRNGIDIPEDHIITIGDDKGEINIPEEKRKILQSLADKYDDITFFDDNPENIKIAQKISKIRTRLIDSLNL